MYQSLIIVRHYLLKSILDPLNTAILLLLPLALVFVNFVMIDTIGIDVSDVLVVSSIAMLMLPAFQLFSPLQHYYLFGDFQGAVRFRLYSAPCSKAKFILSMGIATWIYSVFIGLFFILASSILFGVEWGNMLVVLLVLLLLSVLAQLISIFLFFVTSTRKAAEAGVQVIAWSALILSGGIVNLGNNPVTNFFQMYGTPLSLASRAMAAASFPDAVEFNLGAPGLYLSILAASTGVFAIITVIAGMLSKKEL